MHPGILAKRQLDAQNRIMDSAALLAGQFNIEPPSSVQQRDPEIGMMMRFEVIAQFMEDLALAPEGVDRDDLLAEVLAIEGLTKISGEVIREHFGIEEDDGDSN